MDMTKSVVSLGCNEVLWVPAGYFVAWWGATDAWCIVQPVPLKSETAACVQEPELQQIFTALKTHLQAKAHSAPWGSICTALKAEFKSLK